MFLARIFFIRLQESAKFLVAANRPTAAVIALRKISKMNGEEVRWSLSDVVDDASTGGKEGRGGDYDATGSSPSRGTSPLRSAGSTSLPNVSSLTLDTDADLDLESDADLSASASNVPSFARSGKNRPTWIARFPSAWHSAIEDYAVRIEELLEPEYKRTTLLVWALWTLASAGYTVRLLPLPLDVAELTKLFTFRSSTSSSPSSSRRSCRPLLPATVSSRPSPTVRISRLLPFFGLY